MVTKSVIACRRCGTAQPPVWLLLGPSSMEGAREMLTHNLQLSYNLEADFCRSQASTYSGKPEEAFLLRLADEFEALAERRAPLCGQSN